MNLHHYLQIFEQAAAQLDKKLLSKKKVEVETGIVLESACLKLYKKSWTNQQELPSGSKIFFSVWINDQAIKEQKLLYNIHAFKLRQLSVYSIESRKFADSFRTLFKPFQHQWPNASTLFGPQTLMEGWVKLNPENLQNDISTLSKRFLEMDHLIDDTLMQYLKKK